jgi:hypothetical protein
MSIAEIAPESSPYFSVEYQLQAGGIFINTTPIPNYKGACSKIVGVVQLTALVDGGLVTATQGASPAVIAPPADGYATIRLTSVFAGDLNTYRIYWTNEVAQSQLLNVLPC